MVKVGFLGFQTSKFTKSTDEDISELASRSTIPILNHTLRQEEIEAVIVSSCSTEQYLGPIISESLGLKPKSSFKMDNLCNSGTNSIITAYSFIASGLFKSVLVIGVEKLPTSGSVLKWDTSRGSFTRPVFWASMFAKSHMRKF